MRLAWPLVRERKVGENLCPSAYIQCERDYWSRRAIVYRFPLTGACDRHTYAVSYRTRFFLACELEWRDTP